MDTNSEQIIDQLLFLRSKKGDQAATTMLIKRWTPKIRHKAFLHTGDYEGSSDIVQECWEEILKRRNRLRDPARFGIWVNKIVHSKAVNWIREKQKQRKISASFTDSMASNGGSDLSDSLNLLRKALKGLDQDQQLILSMFYLDGFSVKEISSILNVSSGTVKSRLFYSRKNLKNIYDTLNN